jgi:hypothetical protein
MYAFQSPAHSEEIVTWALAMARDSASLSEVASGTSGTRRPGDKDLPSRHLTPADQALRKLYARG